MAGCSHAITEGARKTGFRARKPLSLARRQFRPAKLSPGRRYMSSMTNLGARVEPWGTSGHAADRVFQAAMALAPLYAGACRPGFVILTAKPIAGHAQRASGGNAGQDDPAPQAPWTWIRAGDRHQRWIIGVPRTPGRRPCRRTPRQSRPPPCSSERLPETSVSLPGITLSDKGGQGERAHCRRSVCRWQGQS